MPAATTIRFTLFMSELLVMTFNQSVRAIRRALSKTTPAGRLLRRRGKSFEPGARKANVFN
jgi:hypothetical protein